jgi:hypothetical protein
MKSVRRTVMSPLNTSFITAGSSSYVGVWGLSSMAHVSDGRTGLPLSNTIRLRWDLPMASKQTVIQATTIIIVEKGDRKSGGCNNTIFIAKEKKFLAAPSSRSDDSQLSFNRYLVASPRSFLAGFSIVRRSSSRRAVRSGRVERGRYIQRADVLFAPHVLSSPTCESPLICLFSPMCLSFSCSFRTLCRLQCESHHC